MECLRDQNKKCTFKYALAIVKKVKKHLKHTVFYVTINKVCITNTYENFRRK